MTLSINTNLMAMNASRNLTSHYSSISSSIRRLSSGLRVSSAADDAAGLAIRELMRSDIAALNQGIRNANDAISMIQTADGALGIIDEKLIRMKELAEQAATGTYNSDQRLMIHSEFQAMAAEIERIATATDFNGVKLLDGSLSGAHNGAGLTSTGAMKIHFGTGNDSAEDYYYIDIGDCTLAGLGLSDGTGTGGIVEGKWWNEAVIDYTKKTIILDIPHRLAGSQDGSPAAVPGLPGIDYYALPIGLKNVTITSTSSASRFAHKPHVCLFTTSGEQLTGPPASHTDNWDSTTIGSNWWNGRTGSDVITTGIKNGFFEPGASYTYDKAIRNAGQSVTIGACTVEMVTSQNEDGATNGSAPGKPVTDEIIHLNEVTEDLVFMIGGHAGLGSAYCNHYKLEIYAEYDETFLADMGIEVRPLSLNTQNMAQTALEKVDTAIIKKDKIRAHLGALQNRFENTASNLRIQAENMQAAESRISDADVSLEMTEFTRSQILTQAATAMLTQANSLPRMLMKLLEG